MPKVGLEGGTRVVTEYAARLSARGHHVRVFACTRLSRPWSVRVKQAVKRLAGRPAEPLPSNATHLDRVPHLFRRLATAGPIRSHHLPEADLVVATWWETVDWVAKLPASHGRKVHLVQHDERVFYRDESTRRRVESVWKQPDFVRVAVSDWVADVGRKEFGVPVDVVGNAVDVDVFHAPPRDRNPTPAVGIMYSPNHFKGLDVALKAWRLAAGRIPNLRLIAFGQKPVADYPLPDVAEHHEDVQQSRLAELYRRCDVYLFASRSEGYGLPILEAMACRTPVVGTPTGAAPELLARGGGRLVPMEDADAMADAVVDLLHGPPDAWKRASDAAYATARHRDWEAATTEFEQVLVDAVEPRRSGTRAAG